MFEFVPAKHRTLAVESKTDVIFVSLAIMLNKIQKYYFVVTVETFYGVDFLSKWSAMLLLWLVISEKRKRPAFSESFLVELRRVELLTS